MILSMNACAELFTENFNSDSGMWSYVSNSHPDYANGYAVLTENLGEQAGIAWLNKDITSDFTAEFSYKTGPNTGGGGDGFVFMFYKQKGYAPKAAGWLGFHDSLKNPVPGYGIEFDEYNNEELFNETTDNHIALIKDSVGNHFATTGTDSRVSDDQWHNVKVVVKAPMITVYLDGTQVLTWTGSIDTTYPGIGFSAGTWSATNQHVIDNFTITTETSSGETYATDFSSQPDPNVWQLVGNPYVDTTNQYLVLTDNQIGEANIIWLKQNLTSDFTASFRYLNNGGGDGMVLMFYKNKSYQAGSGGSLAFRAIEQGYGFGRPVKGYGIEFDTIQNYIGGDTFEDPSARHIALIQDDTGNHLTYVNDARTGDNQWHTVKITVAGNTVTANLDNQDVLTWAVSSFDKTFGGIGVGAATGMATSWQIIDDLKITTDTMTTTSTTTTTTGSTTTTLLPDLSISTSDITFSNLAPVKGDIISINARVYNNGDADAYNVQTKCYDGLPSSGILIGEKTVNIPKNSYADITFQWTASPVYTHGIYFVADSNNQITESDEGNNIANRYIYVYEAGSCSSDSSCGLCQKCVSGACVSESSGEDTKNECPGSFGSCAGSACDGSGKCQYLSAGKQNCGSCQFCTGSSYSCSNMPLNSDPYNDCSASSTGCSSSCVKTGSDGNCNGAGACKTGGASANVAIGKVCSGGAEVSGPCNSAFSCTTALNTDNAYGNNPSGQYYTQGYCDGLGSCDRSGSNGNHCTNGVQDCGETGKDCGGSCGLCPTKCVNDDDCPSNQNCVATVCTDYSGQPCSPPNGILDHYCVHATTYWSNIYDYNFFNTYTADSKGLCLGMTSTASLYFRHYKRNELAYPQYPLPLINPQITRNLIPGDMSVPPGSPYSQWVNDLVYGKLNNVIFPIVFHQIFDPIQNNVPQISEPDSYNNILDSLVNGRPIIVNLEGEGLHAIIAYRLQIDQNKAEIDTYDPNEPGSPKRMEYDFISKPQKFSQYKVWVGGKLINFNIISTYEPEMINYNWFKPSYFTSKPSYWYSTLQNYAVVASNGRIKIHDVAGGIAKIETDGNSQTFSTSVPDALGFSEGPIRAFAIPKKIGWWVDPEANGSSFLFIYNVDNSTNVTSEHSFYVELNSSGNYYFTATPSNDSLLINVSGVNVSVSVSALYVDSANNTVFYNLTKTGLTGNVSVNFETNNWRLTNLSKSFIPSKLFLSKKGVPVPSVDFPSIKVKNAGNASLDSVYIRDEIPTGFYVPQFPAKDKGFKALAGSVLASVGSSDAVDQNISRMPIFVFLESLKPNCVKNCKKLTLIPPRYYKAVLQGQNLTVDFSNISKSSIGRTLKGNESIVVSYAMFAQKDYVFAAGNLSTNTYAKSMDMSGLYEEKTVKQRLELVSMK